MQSNRGEKPIKEPIAIIGQSVLFPASYDSTDFWRNILEGRDLISDVPASHWLIEDYYDPDLSAPDKTYGKRGGFLPYVDFDSLGWGVPPSIIEATDSTQLLALMVAKQCLEDASGGDVESLDKSNMSVILGVTSAQKLLGHMTARLQRPIWENAMRQVGLPESEVQLAAQRIADHYVPWQESTFPGLLGNVVAGRIANRLDLGGTNCVTDAACASAFSAISMAINELYLGDSDIVIAGGADTMSDILMHMCFSKTPALSKTGDVRPFSDQADGTLLGEGIALFAFKRLSDAERDGDQIYGVLKGLGSSSDGRSKSVYAPLAEGQANAYRRAYANAGVDPSTIELIEAHGTGTKAGDAAEFSGLRTVFEEAGAQAATIAMGSVKSQIGHTKATAGAAGLFKALMALRSGVLPPTIKVEQPNPNLNIETTPLYINTEARPWVRGTDHPRRAGVSAFGFGGSNFHILLEEYTGPNKAPRLRAWGHELLMYSADSAEELITVVHGVLSRHTKVSLSRLSWESQQSFSTTHTVRLSIVASSREDAQEKLSQVLEKGFDAPYALPSGVHLGVGQAWSGKTAFLFPGQGAQSVHMGSQVAQSLPQSMEVWDFSADLDRHTGASPLHKVVFPKSVFNEDARKEQQTHLTKTQWAQPAIGVTSMALLNVLEDLGLRADACAGHSYGELTALYYANTFKAQHFIQASQKRGTLMNEAAKLPGAMTAVKGSAKKLQPLLDTWKTSDGIDVVIANHNSPKQSVLSGTVQDIDRVEELLADAGLFAQRLGVATAFHSKVVAGSVRPFEQYLSGLPLKAPECTVYANRTAQPYGQGIPELVSTLSKQIASPVRFVELIEAMHNDGASLFIEVGPRNILGKLVKSILRKTDAKVVSLDRPGKSDLFGLLDGLAQLASLGVPMDCTALWKGYAEPSNFDALPKPKMAISINGANYNKPYPPKEGALGRAKSNPERAAEPSKQTPAQPATKPQYTSSKTESSTVPTTQVQGVTMSNSHNTEGLRAFQQAQQQTAAAHAAYQHAMSNAHLAYLQAAQASLTNLAALASGQAISPTAPVIAAPVPVPVPVVAPAPAPVPAPTFSPIQPPAMPAESPVVSAQPTLAPVSAPPISPPVSVSIPQVTTPATPVTPVTSPSATVDVLSLLMDVVAEKTGYPADALDMSMSLEGDLGIDSIKRVEILSSVQEKAPELPEVDGSQMAQLQTLGEIVEFLGGSEGSQSGAHDTAAVDVLSLLMDVVAEKTGYPADALDMSMSLEGDLGIDSIKRVEILSSVQEKAPELPEVDGSQMAQLQTLGEIVGFLKGDNRDFRQAEASEMGVSANHNPSTETDAVTKEQDGDEESSESSSSDEGSSSESEHELTDVLPQFETLWTSPINRPVYRWVVSPKPKVAMGLMHPALGSASIALLGDEDLTSMMSIQLQRQGIDAHVAESIPLDGEVNGVIDLRALDLDDSDYAMTWSQQCFETAKQLATNHSTTPKVYIHVTQSGGDFGFQSVTNQKALIGGAAGVIRTAQQEWKDSHCKNIDVPTDVPFNQLTRLLVDEIVYGGLDLDVGLQIAEDGSVRRTVLSMFEQDPTGTPIEFFPDEVLVVSGGARGVTADCIIRMVQRQSESSQIIPTIVLLGRTFLARDPFPELTTERELVGALIQQAKSENKIIKPAGAKRSAKRILACREIEETMKTLQRLGAKVHYHSVDVSDGDAIKELFVQLNYGPIVGIVHGAGVLADKRIQDKSSEDFAWVYDVKVQGMGSLLSNVDLNQLKVLVFFSSVAARTGNAGQSDYAAANEVLNRIAHYVKQRHPEMCVRSIGWGPWQGGMVSPELQRHFESRGVGLIPIQAGADVFVEELTDGPMVEVVVGADTGLGDGLKLLDSSVRFPAALRQLLKGHTFKDNILVPMVTVLTLFRDFAVRRGHDPSIKKCNVFNPLHLPEPETSLQLKYDKGNLKLVDATGKPVYGAQAHPFSKEKVEMPLVEDWDKFVDRSQIYDDDVLFHTDAFQVLTEVAVSQSSAAASIETDHAYRELLELDGALQLALRWMDHCTGSPSLPMSIESIQWYSDQVVSQIRLIGHGVRNNVGRCDLHLLSVDETLVVSIEGVNVVGLTGATA